MNHLVTYHAMDDFDAAFAGRLGEECVDETFVVKEPVTNEQAMRVAASKAQFTALVQSKETGTRQVADTHFTPTQHNGRRALRMVSFFKNTNKPFVPLEWEQQALASAERIAQPI